MMRRTLLSQAELSVKEDRIHQKSNSNSTLDQKEGSVDGRGTKLKSQLCKKFMENGFCPYGKRCKFAHGLNELRKNNQYNSKYKTKECGSFKNNHCCIYGDRCNFIHVTDCPPRQVKEQPWSSESHDVEMELIRRVGHHHSKLLTMLQ